MKQVPFYPNHSQDGNRCMLACYGSMLEYYTGKKYSWDELKKYTGFNKKPVWSLQALIKTVNLGITVRMMDPFDYRAFYKQGNAYFKQFLTPEEYEWQMKNAEPLQKSEIPELLEKIDYQNRSASLKDIDDLLRHDMLVMTGLNSRILNDKAGFASHFVLIIEDAGNEYILHDPGLPAFAYRKVPKQKLLKAMGGPKHNNEVSGFGKQ